MNRKPTFHFDKIKAAHACPSPFIVKVKRGVPTAFSLLIAEHDALRCVYMIILL